MITNEEYAKFLWLNGVLWDGIPKKICTTIDSSPFSLYNFIKPLESEFQLCRNYGERYKFWDKHGVSWFNEVFTWLMNYTINKEKESTMKEKEFVLTEDVGLYQFRNSPDLKILEIEVPKDERFLGVAGSCRVWFQTTSGGLDYLFVNIGGNYLFDKSSESKYDIILKSKKRPFTHEEIMQLRREWAVFRTIGVLNAKGKTLNSFDENSYGLDGCGYISLEDFVETKEYSTDDGKTWHRLYKEVNNG